MMMKEQIGLVLTKKLSNINERIDFCIEQQVAKDSNS